MKLWKLTEDYDNFLKKFKGYLNYDTNNLTSQDVAELFVYITAAWYENPKNTMYGLKEHIQKTIFEYVESGILPEATDYNGEYVIYKYDTEFKGIVFISLE